MSVISRLILVQPDERLRESLRFGFEREGVLVTSVEPGEDFDTTVFAEPAQLVIAGGRDADEARRVLAQVRWAIDAAPAALPVLYVGNGIAREQALGEGASEFLGRPAFVRDAVTMAKLLACPRADNPKVLCGELGEHFGLFYLVRALSSVKRRGVLTLVRGLRRGELRFYDGEVTSAQVGVLHGLAALHQLLLWTEARFEVRPENVVRRLQIPLTPAELFADAERFLAELRQVSGSLSPSDVFERDEQQISRVEGTIPVEVESVLELFDGIRTVADVVEDSAYRVFETLRMANRLGELGLVVLRAARPRHKAHTALAIEEWLVGAARNRFEPGEAASDGAPVHVVVRRSEPIGPLPGEPASPPSLKGKSKKKKRRRGRRGRSGDAAAQATHPATQVPARSSADPLVVDWESLLPQGAGAGLASSPVVPSTVAAGEISVSQASGVSVPGPGPGGPARRNAPDEAAGVEPPARERIEELAGAERLAAAFSSGESSDLAAGAADPDGADGSAVPEPIPPEPAVTAKAAVPPMPKSPAVLKAPPDAESEASPAAPGPGSFSPSLDDVVTAPMQRVDLTEPAPASATVVTEQMDTSGEIEVGGSGRRGDARLAADDMPSVVIGLDEVAESAAESAAPRAPAPAAKVAESAPPLKPVAAVKPAEAATSAEPAPAAKPVEPATPVEPAMPVEPANVATPAEPATPVEPAKVATPAEPATPVEPAKVATPAEPAKVATLAEPAKPATPAEAAKLATPAEPAKPAATPALPDLPIGEPASTPPARPAASSPPPTRARTPTGPGWSAAEEEFFAQGANLATSTEPVESFDDLDEGNDLPQTFWKRLFRTPGAAPRSTGQARAGHRNTTLGRKAAAATAPKAGAGKARTPGRRTKK